MQGSQRSSTSTLAEAAEALTQAGKAAPWAHGSKPSVREDVGEEEGAEGRGLRLKLRPLELGVSEPLSAATTSNPSTTSSSVSTPQTGAPRGEPRSPRWRAGAADRRDEVGQPAAREQDAADPLETLLGGKVQSRAEELRRLVQSLLNKACPENASKLVGRFMSNTVPQSGEELVLFTGLITKNAVAEPQYTDTYADLVSSLIVRMPEFPSAGGGKPVTLKLALLNSVQGEYESIPFARDVHLREPEWQRQKARFLAIMQFIGKLFSRKLLPVKVVAGIAEERLRGRRPGGQPPAEHCVECACELLRAAGQTLELVPLGEGALTRVCSRLQELAGQIGADGAAVYSKRIRFLMQDVVDARAAHWRAKATSDVARTKEEVRLEQERELSLRAARRYRR